MTKLSMLCAVVLVLMPLSVSAQYVDRYVDILEPGNPGGWENSLKTWDFEYSMNVGDTIEFDVWLSDTGDGFMEASYWAVYDPSQLGMFGVVAYDGVSFPGPWDPEMHNIFPDAWGQEAYYYVDLFSYDCLQPDSDGQMIIARGWIESKSCGDATIRFQDIPAL